MAPVLWAAVTILVLLAAALGSDAFGVAPVTDVLGWLSLIVFASVPWVFLIGLVRTRVAGAGAVSRGSGIGEETGPEARCRLSQALGDDSLQLAFWLEDKGRWVDADGHVVELPESGPRAWTAVELEGRVVGAIVHDVTLTQEPELLRSVAAAAGLAMESERLQAQLRARVEELRASRIGRRGRDGGAPRPSATCHGRSSASWRYAAMRLAQPSRQQDRRRPSRCAAAHEETTLALASCASRPRIHPAVLSAAGSGGAGGAGRRARFPSVAESPTTLPEPIEAGASSWWPRRPQRRQYATPRRARFRRQQRHRSEIATTARGRRSRPRLGPAGPRGPRVGVEAPCVSTGRPGGHSRARYR